MQILLNILLYGFLVFWLCASVLEQDYWFAFVVLFLIAVSVVLTLLPSYHAAKVSPGEYPYED
jgi:hypothetical protein